MAEPLTTIERLALALGKSVDELSDTEIEAYETALMEASDALRYEFDLNFELNDPAAVASPRVFEYDGSGILPIDEAVEVIDATVEPPFAQVFALEEWEPRKQFRAPVYTYLSLPPGIGLVSREMGFTYNLDRYEGPYRSEPTRVTVTARWGWPAIPENVQRATVWTAIALHENPRPYISESIEGYSRTLGPVPTDAIPPRAIALMQPFERLTLV